MGEVNDPLIYLVSPWCDLGIGLLCWGLAFAKSTALWKQWAQADWALSLLTPTTELWLPKLGIRRYHQSKPEFWTPLELSDNRMVISVNLSFGNTASLWSTRGSRSTFPSPVKKRISRSSQRRNRIRKEAFFSRKKAFPSPSAPSLPFWTLLPLRPKDVDSSGILDEEAEHTETGINNKSKRVPVSVLAMFCFSLWKADIWERTWVVLS